MRDYSALNIRYIAYYISVLILDKSNVRHLTSKSEALEHYESI